jgi:hypothetical protein
MIPLRTSRGKSKDIIQIPSSSSMPSSTKAVLNPSKAKPPLLA